MALKKVLDFLTQQHCDLLLEDFEAQCAVASAVARTIRLDGNLTTLKSMLLEGDNQAIETADIVINTEDDKYYGVSQDCNTDAQIKVAEMLADVLKVRFMPFANEDLIYIKITEITTMFAAKLDAINLGNENVDVALAKLRETAVADVEVAMGEDVKNALNRLIATLPEPTVEAPAAESATTE